MDAGFATGGAGDAALGPSQKIKEVYWCLLVRLLTETNLVHNGFQNIEKIFRRHCPAAASPSVEVYLRLCVQVLVKPST